MADAHVTLVIDRSGSMQSTRKDAQGGLDSFVAGLPVSEDVTVALVEFDSVVSMAVPPTAVAAWPGYTLTPRGSTALLDAIGFAVKKTKKHLKTNPAEKVVLVVVTDGGENCSQKFTKEQVGELVDKVKADGWEILFLASDLSAIQTGADVGLSPVMYAPASTGRVYSEATRSVSSFVSGATATVNYDAAATTFTPEP